MTLLGPLPGGSESYVARARTRDGGDRVVKLGIPGNDLTGEAAVLAAADGHGYAVLHAHDVERSALLMELLGTSLHRLAWSPERTLAVLADTLVEAWQVPLETAPAVTAGIDDKATLLHGWWATSGSGWSARARRRSWTQALRYADRRAAAFDPDRCVVVHGDPHPGNTLRVTAPRDGAESGFVLVDPDGFRCDPAYDLGVAVRDWRRRTQARSRATAALLADRTGVAAQEIWEWGYLERVSTGLYVLSFGAERIGRAVPDVRRAAARREPSAHGGSGSDPSPWRGRRPRPPWVTTTSPARDQAARRPPGRLHQVAPRVVVRHRPGGVRGTDGRALGPRLASRARMASSSSWSGSRTQPPGRVGPLREEVGQVHGVEHRGVGRRLVAFGLGSRSW